MFLSNVAAINFSICQVLMAGLFLDLARRRPQVETEAKIYAACALAFASAKLPMIFGMPEDVGRKFFVTMSSWSDIAYLSIVLLRLVSRETLALNAAATALGMVAIVAVLDPYVQMLCDMFDFAAVAVLGLSIAAADAGKNPIATKCLTFVTALYAVVQLDLAGKGSAWFSALISSSSLAFSLCLLIVLYGREDETACAVAVR